MGLPSIGAEVHTGSLQLCHRLVKFPRSSRHQLTCRAAVAAAVRDLLPPSCTHRSGLFSGHLHLSSPHGREERSSDSSYARCFRGVAFIVCIRRLRFVEAGLELIFRPHARLPLCTVEMKLCLTPLLAGRCLPVRRHYWCPAASASC